MFGNELYFFKIAPSAQYLLGILWMLFEPLANTIPLLIVHTIFTPSLTITMPIQPL